MPANPILGSRANALTAALGPSMASAVGPASFGSLPNATQSSFADPQPKATQATFAPTLQQSTPNQATFGLQQSTPSQASFAPQGAPNPSQPAFSYPAGGQQYSTNANGVGMWQPQHSGAGSGRIEDLGIYYNDDGQASVNLSGIGNLWGGKAANNVAAQMNALRSGDQGKYQSTMRGLFPEYSKNLWGDPQPKTRPDAPAPSSGTSVMDVLGGSDPLVDALADTTGQGMGFQPGDRGYGDNSRTRPRYGGDSRFRWGGWR